MYFHELTVIDYGTDYLIHVVSHVRIVGDNLVQAIFLAVDGVGAFNAGSTLHVVLRNVREEATNNACKLFFCLSRKVTNTTLRWVNGCTTEVFLGYVLTRYGLNYLRTSKEHITDTFEHYYEVGQCRRVNGTTSARTADTWDLGYYARSFNVALEDFAETSQCVDTLLNTSTTWVVQANARSTHLHTLVHYLAYLLSHGLWQRTTIYGKVLCKDVNQTAVDRTATSYNAVAQKLLLLHAKVVATVKFEHIHFFEWAFVKQKFNAFASCSLALGVLFLNSLLATA